MVIAPLYITAFHWGTQIHFVRSPALPPHCGDYQKVTKALFDGLTPGSQTLPGIQGR